MTLPTHIHLIASALPEGAQQASAIPPGAKVWQVLDHTREAGWVARSAAGEWLAWNREGRFWVSYAKTRAEAATGLWSLPWSAFMTR